MLKMGKYLLTFSRDDKMCAVWDTSDEEDEQFSLIRTHQLPHDSTITCVIHPNAYLDKVLIGTEEGHFDLYNIRVGELVHRFSAFPLEKSLGDNVLQKMILRNVDGDDGEQNSTDFARITSMCNSPSLDVVAIGLSDGKIMLYNIRYEKVLFTLTHTPGPVTSLSFRTDAVPGLVSGTARGEIGVWDLEKRSLVQLLPHAHSSAVTQLLFVPYEPVLVSSGADNTLQTYIFDRPDKPRMENRKEGHSQPPTSIKFYDPCGNWLITAGTDQQVRITSLVDRVTGQISQKLKEKKKKLQQKNNDSRLEDQNIRLLSVTGLDT